MSPLPIMTPLCLASGLLVSAAYGAETGGEEHYQTAEQVLAEFASEPPIQRVQAWASEAARSEPERVARLLRASRTFAAWPQLKLQYRIKDERGQDWIYRTGAGGTPVPDQDLFSVLDEAERDLDHWVTMEARWDLQELVMSSEHIRMINEAQDLVKLRDTVLAEVTRLYYDRRRQQVQMLLSPPDALQARLDDALRLQELTAAIDALTAGQFSHALGDSSRRSEAP